MTVERNNLYLLHILVQLACSQCLSYFAHQQIQMIVNSPTPITVSEGELLGLPFFLCGSAEGGGGGGCGRWYFSQH